MRLIAKRLVVIVTVAVTFDVGLVDEDAANDIKRSDTYIRRETELERISEISDESSDVYNS